MKNRLTIAVDIDDVLAANAEHFVAFSNKKWGTNLKPDDYSEHWAEIWKVDYEEESRRRDVIVKNKVFLKHRFFDDAKPALEELKKNFRLVVVSSRGPGVREDTIQWLNKEFEGIFDGIDFAPIWDSRELHTLEKLKFTKADLLQQIGADYLIDDQPKHCLAAADAGIKAVIFGDYKWNRDIKLRPNMIRAKTWSEVLEYFEREQGR
jgi:5'(3')-deoxyribonucleotidase